MRRGLLPICALVGCGNGSDPPGDTGPTDTTPPEIVSTTPGDNELDRPPSQDVIVEFSEAIDAATVTEASLFVQVVGGDKVAGTLAVDGTTVTFVPSAPYPIETKFELRIEASVADLAGNTLLAARVVRFDTLHRRRVFVTSVTGPSRLANFPGAGANVGLVAADAACQARADATNLGGTFVAWLSDLNDDAYCRVHGLTGKRSANCGQAALPVAAGPWVRVDQQPWRAAIDQGQVFAPLLDEFGLAPNARYFSNSDPTGARAAGDCTNWTNPAIGGTSYGGGTTTGDFWTSWGTMQCNEMAALLCVEVGTIDITPPLPFPAVAGKRAFVTSTSVVANLQTAADANGEVGIAAGDAICRARAAGAGLPNPTAFKAWLSDGTTTAQARFTSNGPWSRVDGMKLADSKADLVDGKLATTLDQDETGAYVSGAQVWTGTHSDGTAAESCTSWTAGAGTTGAVGRANNASAHWSHDADLDCGQAHRLYCLED